MTSTPSGQPGPKNHGRFFLGAIAIVFGAWMAAQPVQWLWEVEVSLRTRESIDRQLDQVLNQFLP